MASPISGKTVLITGASRGIGLELAKQLLSKGNHVIAAVRSPKTAAALHSLPPAEGEPASAQRAKLSLVQLDVSDARSIEAATQELLALLANRHIDVVINNAGVLVDQTKAFGELTTDDFNTTFQTNSSGPFLFTQALFKAGLIGASGQPSLVVNMSSLLGAVGLTGDWVQPNGFAYRASKAALNMLTKYTDVALRDKGVTAVAISPGYVDTDMNGHTGVISVEDSVDGILNVLEDGRDLHARFYSYSGEELPW